MGGRMTEIIPYLLYEDVSEALSWLGSVFGFTEDRRDETPGGGVHAEMSLHGQRIMLGQPQSMPPEGGRVGIFVYLADVDAHYSRAVDAGAAIQAPPHDLSYGRTYTATDLGGHTWYFCTGAG